MKLQSLTLAGSHIRLEPLGPQHASDLADAATDQRIWIYLDEPQPWTRATVDRFVSEAQAEQLTGRRIAFAIVERSSERAVGSTSYLDIRPHDRGVEIGWTWLAPFVWNSGVNTEAKYLLLSHAFDAGAIRVAIKTDRRNERSQRAIEALGATREGVWRNHRVLSTGAYRDTVYYSIIDSEWPAVREHLQTRLARKTRTL
jgi:N-acetyltransferase